MTLQTSPRGAFALACHEGIVPSPYLDSVGVWTWGIGHTKAAGDPDPASMPRGQPGDIESAISECLAAFRRDLHRYEAAVATAVKVPVAQHEFDALVSFHYNTGAIAKASLTAALNRGDRQAAADGFLNWIKPPELIGRRRKERELFRSGTYPAGPVNIWRVSPTNRVVFRPIRTLTQGQFLAAFGAA